MELDEIKYNFVIELTKFFLDKYKTGEIKNLNAVVSNVKSISVFVKEIDFVYDETIWFPDQPETFKNLIQFKIQLSGNLGYLPFRLFIKKGKNQNAILLNNQMIWE